MIITGEVSVDAKRWTLSRLKFGRALLPIAIVVGIVARRSLWTPLVVVGCASMAVSLYAMLSARRSIGRRVLAGGRGVLHLRPHGVQSAQENGDDIPVREVKSWTWDGARAARLYGPHYAWRLRTTAEAGEMLNTLLRHQIGPPYLLRRRGSPRVRWGAFVVMLLGPIAVWFGIAFEVTPVLVVGILCFVLGFATFGAFSQRVVR